jgi:hypothetical protein
MTRLAGRLVAIVASAGVPALPTSLREPECPQYKCNGFRYKTNSLAVLKRGKGKRAMQRARAAPEAKERRKQAGTWLKELRSRAGLSQVQLAERLGLKYYTFISQVENGFGRVPADAMEAWARALGIEPAILARRLLSFYDPELYRVLFEADE